MHGGSGCGRRTSSATTRPPPTPTPGAWSSRSQALDFLVVNDIFLTETARLAHVVLPAAAFAEKDGTFVNADRQVQRVRKAVEPPPGLQDRRGDHLRVGRADGLRDAGRGRPARSWTKSPRWCRSWPASATSGWNGQSLVWPCLEHVGPRRAAIVRDGLPARPRHLSGHRRQRTVGAGRRRLPAHPHHRPPAANITAAAR